MSGKKLHLSREQLATFLKNHEQIKQFENLFRTVDDVVPASDTQGISVQAGNADALANEAMAQIIMLAQDANINVGAAEQKAVQALDTLNRIAVALEMLATAPIATAAFLQGDNLIPQVEIGTMGHQQSDKVDITGGAVTARLKNNQTTLLETTTTLSDGAAADRNAH